MSWNEQLDDIAKSVHRASHNADLWSQINVAMRGRSAPTDWTWFRSYTSTYTDSQLMFVRRMAETGDQAGKSLARLITAIAKNAAAATFERYEHVHDSPEEWERQASHERQLSWFAATFGREDHADAPTLNRWVADLQGKALRVTTFATKTVAHRDDDPFDVDEQLTFGELDAALDLVYEYFNQVSTLLRNSVTLLPPAIQTDWQEPLRTGIFAPLTPWSGSGGFQRIF